MAVTIQAPKGTEDVLGSESYQWQFIENMAKETAARYGFLEQRTPTFESMALFRRSVGDTTDVVQKEMYQVRAETESSKKEAELFALKPEGTAGAVRAVIQRGLLNQALPLRVYYITSCFRHENTQKGRLREFHQFGVEMFGAQNPGADVEVMSLVRDLFDRLGLKNITLNINSIGCPKCRGEYHKALKEYFSARKDQLCPTCLERLEKNPMRILDCKNPECAALAAQAPVVLDYLCQDCRDHFDGVKRRLDCLGMEYTVDPHIVRGLDYYTKTVFEFVSSDLGAQSTVCGGGRYDGLVEQMGGPATPALGFAMGLERLLLILKAQGIEIPKPESCLLYLGSMGEEASIRACQLTNQLRREGFYVECDVMGRGVKAQMKYANKIGAKFSLVLGENELKTGRAMLKDMETGGQTEVELDKLADRLYDVTLAGQLDQLTQQVAGDASLASLRSLLDGGKGEK